MLSWALLVKDPCDTADGLLSPAPSFAALPEADALGLSLKGELSKTYGAAFSCGIIRMPAARSDNGQESVTML